MADAIFLYMPEFVSGKTECFRKQCDFSQNTFFRQQTKVIWNDMRRNCQGLGANLASVHNKPENEFLLGLLPTASSRGWIGAHDGEQEGQWLWTNGTVNDFTNWCAGEPNNLGTENCVDINWTSNRCWNDWTCAGQIGYFCVTDA
ncbi:ladderlectin-like [Chanodichthys erythropterus]|uniref:ladderlectin-like n=1 Tax=Chanodichthys erythropterus TaxID=933992 RepID=UPI00351E5EEB